MDVTTFGLNYVDEVKRILKNYLNQIIYIDDIFNLSLVKRKDEDNNEFSNFRRPIMLRKTNTKVDVSSPDNDSEQLENAKSDLEELLVELQKEHKDIRLFPFKYSGPQCNEAVENCVNSFHLIIIDWNLYEKKYTAANVLKDVINNTQQMRFIVVYTSRQEEAEDDFINVFGDMRFDVRNSVNDRKYKYCLYKDSSMIMLCSKDTFNIEQIIDEFSKLIIENFGYFPIAFFDTILNLNAKTGKLLKKFAHPFESLLMLQMQASGLDYEELPDLVSGLVTSHINEELELNPDIINTIYGARIAKIKDLSDKSDKSLMQSIDNTIKILCDNYKGDSKNSIQNNLSLFKEIEISKFKQWLSQIGVEPVNWNNSLKKLTDDLIGELVNIKAIKKSKEYQFLNDIEDAALKEKAVIQISDNYKQVYKNEIKDFTEKVLPIFLMLLCDESIPGKMPELISSLKLIEYEEKEIKDTVDDCISRKKSGKLDEKQTSHNLRNFFHSGDILIFKDEKDTEKYMLCITPACDVFRLDKVKCKLSFIVGDVLNAIPLDRQKESTHLTVLPGNEGDGLKCIKWQFFNTKMIDLGNIEDVEILRNCIRPYRLTSDYIRQIVGKYIAYYSRVGVEEVFIKQAPEVGNIFID